MHELVRNRNKFTITPSLKDKIVVNPGGVIGAFPFELENELEKSVWSQFVTSKKLNQEYIKTSVTDSWKRCLHMGVDPSSKRCEHFCDRSKLDTEHHFLRDAVKNTPKDLYSYLDSKGLLFTVSDRYGYLTATIGSYKTLSMADGIDFGPEADWSERSVGTNAIGLALTSGLPHRVIGKEHFCESQHGWTCSAAPIFDLHGVLLGSVDISGPNENEHDRCLALAMYYARAIEALYIQKQCMGMIGTVLNHNAIGLITLDRYGKVCYCNQAAAELFESSLHKLSGKDASKWFDLSPFFSRQAHETLSDSFAMEELRCLHNPTWNIYATPLVNNFNHLHGLTLCIYPPLKSNKPAAARTIDHDDGFAGMIGESVAFQKVVKTAKRVSPTDTTVLITGQSGTGKEVMARALHRASPRAKKPFVAVNCGAIAPELIQSELFGYVEGSFTGASKGGQAGKFEQASGGTIFLDEIGEMPLSIQVNLLRVLDEHQVTRVGGKRSLPIDVRVIAATNRNMEAMVEERTFRKDLYYRLHVVNLVLPQLNQRETDIQLLADHFIQEFSQKLDCPIDAVDPAFREALAAYSWPGNIRELRHVIESTMVLLESTKLSVDTLPPKVQEAIMQPQIPASSGSPQFTSLNFDEIQKQALQQALVQYNGNVSQMAKALGIGRNTTYAKLKKFGLL
ncbi:sigma-54-dependent Fis family transcriptional regulator [Desulfobulbus rhabdoformis]|uniref:sigma-54-dependent Fis family transcriptional regulator n=1 Tax=Desulfobulbus rhabdoformis TaxID=34032 RepID=UPI0019641CC4|nr:sigma-54-dependent Fis family transcriptional regulator [Desulfobulbus rhabdoformis]MBM9613849.1 sigma-54-dependent Fis family transcriptional regulator [Desulfobulbus rhabdoformis]